MNRTPVRSSIRYLPLISLFSRVRSFSLVFTKRSNVGEGESPQRCSHSWTKWYSGRAIHSLCKLIARQYHWKQSDLYWLILSALRLGENTINRWNVRRCLTFYLQPRGTCVFADIIGQKTLIHALILPLHSIDNELLFHQLNSTNGNDSLTYTSLYLYLFVWFESRTAFLYQVTLISVEIGVPSQVKTTFSCKSTFWIRGKFVVMIGTPNKMEHSISLPFYFARIVTSHDQLSCGIDESVTVPDLNMARVDALVISNDPSHF